MNEPNFTLPRRAHGEPVLRARYRERPEDFVVEEQLGYEASGEGPHELLLVEKRGQNTLWVARRLADHAGVQNRDVGFAGLKDRHAVTTQHFTVPAGDHDWDALEVEGVRVLWARAHRRKLKRGALAGNRFRITLRGLEALGDIEGRLERICTAGVPNGFGIQRFGRGGSNLARYQRMVEGQRVKGREQRAILLSAARSELFNRVLDLRIERGVWDRILPGERVMLDGSRSQFDADPEDAELQRRVEEMDVHPTGPLPGRGQPGPTGVALELEQKVLAEAEPWIDHLSRAGLDADRRALRMRVDALSWSRQDDELVLTLELPAGGFATQVLHELGEVSVVDHVAEGG